MEELEDWASAALESLGGVNIEGEERDIEVVLTEVVLAVDEARDDGGTGGFDMGG